MNKLYWYCSTSTHLKVTNLQKVSCIVENMILFALMLKAKFHLFQAWFGKRFDRKTGSRCDYKTIGRIRTGWSLLWRHARNDLSQFVFNCGLEWSLGPRNCGQGLGRREGSTGFSKYFELHFDWFEIWSLFEWNPRNSEKKSILERRRRLKFYNPFCVRIDGRSISTRSPLTVEIEN